MGSSQSSNSKDYKQQLGYYPNFDSRHIEDQDFKIVHPRHLNLILSGNFFDLFEDEDVEQVWIYSCSLRNLEGARIGAVSLGSVAAGAGVLCLVPGASKIRRMISVILTSNHPYRYSTIHRVHLLGCSTKK